MVLCFQYTMKQPIFIFIVMASTLSSKINRNVTFKTQNTDLHTFIALNDLEINLLQILLLFNVSVLYLIYWCLFILMYITV